MKRTGRVAAAVLAVSLFAGQASAYEAEAGKDIIRQGLLGAATGALSAGASGGKAGKGALIGAGTSVIGSALLSFLTGGSASRQTAPQYSSYPVYSQPQPVASRPVYVQTAPVYVEPQPVYAQPVSYSYASQPDSNTQIIRQGLLGAGVGAISSGASGGKAGTGALIGAGTTVIGGALLDTLFAPAQPRTQAYYYGTPSYAPAQGRRIIKTYDSAGNLISEQVV